jgi:hypothetical protein
MPLHTASQSRLVYSILVGVGVWIGVTIIVVGSRGTGQTPPNDPDKSKSNPAQLKAPTEELGLVVRMHNLEREVATLTRTAPPVGSILPFVGDPATLPPEWQVCNGEPLKDPTSPLMKTLAGGKVPDLSDRFVRGTKNKDQLQKTGGSDSYVAAHSHAAVLETVYAWRRDNFDLRKPGNDPRELNAYVTNHSVFGHNNGDAARPKAVGKTAEETLNVPTVPQYYQTYYIIRIK